MIYKVVLLLSLCCFFSTILTAQAKKPLTNFNIDIYEFRIKVFENHDTIEGYTTITYEKLHFNKNNNTLILNLKNKNKFGKGMLVESVTNSRFQKIKFTHKNDLLAIEVNEKYVFSTINIAYKGIPNNGLIIGKNKFGDRTWFADNWPNRAQYWLPCVDHPADKARIKWEVTAPEGYEIVANGLLTYAPDFENRKEFVEGKNIPTKVASIGIAKLKKRELFFRDSIPVTNFMYPQTFAKQPNKMDVSLDILTFFEEKIGAYPYDKLYNVQSTTMFGGMENANNIFYDEYTVDDTATMEPLIAHEIAHQWFGNTVTEKDFSHLWLSEGFATFYTNYYLENKYGKVFADARIKKDYEKVKTFLAKNKRTVVDSTNNLMSLLNANSYEKGGLFLWMLRKKLGDTKFDAVIKKYFETYKYKNANTDDFKKIVEKETILNLTVFFKDWLFSTILPPLN